MTKRAPALEIPRERGLSEQLKRQIFSAAMEVFAERGFEGAKVEEVAERAGMGRATIYYHFRSKRDLFMFLLQEGIEEMGTAVQAAVDRAQTPLEELEAVIDAHVDFYSEYPAFAKVVLSETWRVGPGNDTTAPRLLSHDLKVVARAFAAAQEAGVLKPQFGRAFLVSGFYGLIAATAVYSITLEHRLDPDSLKRDLKELLFRGSLADGHASRPGNGNGSRRARTRRTAG